MGVWRRVVLAGVMAIGAVGVRGDGGTQTAPAPAPVDPEVITVQLMDGSQITGKLSVKQVEVQTPYGTLQVPVTDIQSITPGLGAHPTLAAQLAGFLDKLDSDVFADREAAQAGLQKMGPAVRPQLMAALKTAGPEKKTRLQTLLGEIDELTDGDDSDTPLETWKADDAVQTGKFTIVGKVTTGSFQIASLYGPLNVKLDDVKRAYKPAGAPEEIRKAFPVPGDNTVFKTWVDPNITVEKGDQITIRADGQVTMTPWGGNARSGPDGGQNFGQFQAGDQQIWGGTLVARIGKGGPAIKVGSKCTFRADRAGKISFAMAMQGDYANQQFPGEYNVKIRVGK